MMGMKEEAQILLMLLQTLRCPHNLDELFLKTVLMQVINFTFLVKKIRPNPRRCCLLTVGLCFKIIKDIAVSASVATDTLRLMQQ